MKIVILSGSDDDVLRKFLRLKKEIETKLEMLESKNYNMRVEIIEIKPIIIYEPKGYEAFLREKVEFIKEERKAGVSLRVSYHEFKFSGEEDCKKLLIKNIVHSIDALREKVKEEFDEETLKIDLLKLF